MPVKAGIMEITIGDIFHYFRKIRAGFAYM